MEDLINIFQGYPTLSLTGSVSGDVNTGDAVTLSINGNLYGGTVDANSNFSIEVDGNDIVSDIDGEIEVFVSNGICSITDTVLIELPQLSVENLLQRFCVSDLAVVADLQVEGNDIVFFDSLTGGIMLDANTPLVDGGVYFAGVLNVPASILARVQITVELISVPPATTESTEQTFCEDDSPVVADIQVNESDVGFLR